MNHQVTGKEVDIFKYGVRRVTVVDDSDQGRLNLLGNAQQGEQPGTASQNPEYGVDLFFSLKNKTIASANGMANRLLTIHS